MSAVIVGERVFIDRQRALHVELWPIEARENKRERNATNKHAEK
jgi:hypothetical protein